VIDVPSIGIYRDQRDIDIAGSTPASVRSSRALIRAQRERFCAGEPLLNMIIGEY